VLPQQSSSASLVVTQGPGGNFEAMTSFLTEQQDKFVSLLREERETAEKQRRDSEAKLDEQQQQMEQQRQESEAKAERLRQETQRDIEQQRQETQQVRAIASAKSAVSEYQLELLQTRIDALHQAKLLTDDEIGALEDCIADYIDCRSSLDPTADEISLVAEKVKKMVGLSEGMGKDGMLARQLRRKFAAGH
jgi:vacuolar-type H+-ATPase subunit I/STV1